MRYFFTGGTGYMGSHLVGVLRQGGHSCTVLSRSGRNPWNELDIQVLKGDPRQPGPWQEVAGQADVVVNLAGERLVDPPHRWTEERKRIIRTSRVETTHRVTEAIAAAAQPPRRLVSASAVGYYGNRGDAEITESTGPGSDFLATVCADWEAAAMEARGRCAVTLLRSAPVLGPEAPVLQPMLTPFRLGLGGAWGSGQQWWPWIHIDDVVGLIRHSVEQQLDGPINLAAPAPIRVAEFAQTLGEVLRRPTVTRVPEFALRLAFGEAADALLVSQRVLPAQARQAGYVFRHTDIEGALRASV